MHGFAYGDFACGFVVLVPKRWPQVPGGRILVQFGRTMPTPKPFSLRTFKVVGEGEAATAEEVSVDPRDLRREMVEDTSGAYDPTVPAEGAWVGRPAPEAMSDEEKSYCANFSDLLCKEKSLLPGLVHDVGEGRLAAWESVSSDKLFAEDVVTEKQAALIEFRAHRGPLSEHQRKARVAKLSRYFENYEGKSFEFLPRRAISP